ncbi:LysR family transcriptional regulator [Cupriavidus necator]|uniref:LysR family transcriptional regulator n=1 Tax=Cupriavidus necator TaxID=106590 RepID=UPI0005B30950|nr:LysR family transcriptional regulator [Cupriavidus necator]
MGRPPAAAKAEGASLANQGVLDSRRLLYFFHVARTGSFTVAETILNVAQSAISRQIQLLESELDVQLLSRNGRGVSLTPAGEILFGQAKAILDEMSETMDRLRVSRRSPGGQVSIASFASVMSVVMPEVIRRFQRSYPDVEITARQGATGEVYDQLARGEVDVAILSQPMANKRVVQHKLLVEPLSVVVAKSHPMAGKPHLEREDLASLEFVLPASQRGLRQLIEQYVGPGAELVAPIRADSTSLMKALVRTGRYATLLPQLSFAPAEEPQPDDFSLIPLKPKFTRTLVVAALAERAEMPLVASLIKEVQAAFQQYGRQVA